MRTITDENLAAAERFVWTSARLLDRLRFAHLVRGTSGDRGAASERVVAVLRPYQNPDGGFGEAIEPDFRGPVSQPLSVESALRHLDEVGALDPGVVIPACDFLASVTTVEGGVPFVLPSAALYPRAPWWEPEPGAPASILPTASIVGLLHKHGIEHNWLGPATAFCWRAIERLEAEPSETSPIQLAYEGQAAVTFLSYVPDRSRAEAAADRLHGVLSSAGVLATGTEDPVEAQGPLDYARRPASIARRWFDDATIDAHLDAMVAAQEPDGGWTFPWLVWTPVTEHEWRGRVTVERLATLVAYGRVESVPPPRG
jgi:hypothetical protein